MQREKREVLIHKDNKEAIEKIFGIVTGIQGFEPIRWESENYVKFDFVGTMLDGLPLMAAGAASVS